jgi:sialidase-1
MGIQWERGPYAGRLVVPIHHGGGEPAKGNRLIFSDDGGKTWVCSPGHVEGRSDESQIVELASGALLLNGRGGTSRWHATTEDWGRTWSPAFPDPILIEPKGGDGSGCQASLVRNRRAGDSGDGWLLFSSPSHPENRANLTIRFSRDEGRSWAVARTLHPLAAGYSCLAVLPDGTIGVLFEGADTPVFSRERGARPAGWMNLLFARFNLAWLESSAKAP